MTDVFAKAAEVGRQMEASGHSFKGEINVYACTPPMMSGSTMEGGCLHWIVTIDRAAGVTPMFVKCGHCGGTASSRMYKVGGGGVPTHEWYRPASEADLPEGLSLERAADHLQNGGLFMRPIDDGKWIEPTPEIRAFVEREQAMLSQLGGAPPPTPNPPVRQGALRAPPGFDAPRPTRQQRRHAQRKGRGQ